MTGADTPKARTERARRLRDEVERLERKQPPANPRTPREFTQPRPPATRKRK